VEVLALVLLYAYLVKKRKKLLPFIKDKKEEQVYEKVSKILDKAHKKDIIQKSSPKISLDIKKKFKNQLRNLKPTKPEHYFIFIVYLLVFSVFAYFIAGNLWPTNTPFVNEEKD